MGIKDFSQRGRAALLCAVVVAGLAVTPSHAASRTASSTALVLRPATLVNTGPLSFGNLLPGATGGTATVQPNGARLTAGGVTPAGGVVSAAGFAGMNDTGGFIFDLVRITIPAGSITLTRVGGGATMTVDNFTSSLGAGVLGSDYYIIPPNTVYTFTVGGRLSVAANQMQGIYNGTFNVTADYQ